jgi:transcriptional regulator with XRE-family HTH domain
MANPLLDDRTSLGIGHRLTLTRRAFGAQQQAFAERAGVNASAYNQYERGTRVVSGQHAHRLCDAYQLTLDWIYRGDPSGLRHQTWDVIRALDAHGA